MNVALSPLPAPRHLTDLMEIARRHMDSFDSGEMVKEIILIESLSAGMHAPLAAWIDYWQYISQWSEAGDTPEELARRRRLGEMARLAIEHGASTEESAPISVLIVLGALIGHYSTQVAFYNVQGMGWESDQAQVREKVVVREMLAFKHANL